MDVDLFIPCYIDHLFPQVAWNMIKVLEKLNCQVHYNPDQTCCGQHLFRAGYEKETRALVKKFVQDFSHPERFIVAPSGQCTAMLRHHYASLLPEDTPSEWKHYLRHSFEFSEFITDVLEINEIAGARLEGKATFLDNCLALRECGIKESPRRLLEKVAGLELVEMRDQETCCGFGDHFSVRFATLATALAERKIDQARATQADFIISTDVSCLIHLQGYISKNRKPIQVMHLADVLAQGWE
ncbi:MAG: (Fe-S)-binding protein [Bacteroidota bacterium]